MVVVVVDDRPLPGGPEPDAHLLAHLILEVRGEGEIRPEPPAELFDLAAGEGDVAEVGRSGAAGPGRADQINVLAEAHRLTRDGAEKDFELVVAAPDVDQ